ncbi:MAG: elongation factor 1-beta [Promethearchaeota archaeon]
MDKIANVVVQMKVLPEGIEVDLNKLQEQIKDVLPENIGIYKVVEEHIAFGLKCLKVTIIMPEAEGGTDPIENMISSIKDVSRVEVELVSRM